MDVDIVPFQGVSEALINNLVLDLRRYQIRARVRETDKLPADAFNPAKSKYIADQVLTFIKASYHERVLGVISEDMYRYILEYIRGFADLPGRGAVISVYRLKSIRDEQLYRSHVCELALHELGHTFGLEHCKDENCVMYQGVVRAQTPFRYCDVCKSKSGLLA